jgi:hypothetical protein
VCLTSKHKNISISATLGNLKTCLTAGDDVSADFPVSASFQPDAQIDIHAKWMITVIGLD